MTTTETITEASTEEATTLQPSKEDNLMATAIVNRQLDMERQLKAGWPVLLMVFGVAAYACVCMIALVVGMTIVAG